MTRYRRFPAFEQFEAKLPLAADVCEHEGVEAAPVVESSPDGAEQIECATFGASAAFQSASSIGESQALSSQVGVEDDEEENEQVTDDEDETDDEDSDDDEDESDDVDEDETDGEDEDHEDESEDDDDDEDETVLTTTLTGTGTGSAEFESETEDGGTERELTIEVSGTTPGTHEVKINSTVVGSIVVGLDGTGRLELSSDPDDDETQLPDSVTITSGTTVMVGTVLMGTFPTTTVTATAAPLSQASASAVNEALLVASGSNLGPAAKAATSQALVADTALADLLLAITDLPADDELESTEFVGRSDERDSTTDAGFAVYETAINDEGESPAGA